MTTKAPKRTTNQPSHLDRLAAHKQKRKRYFQFLILFGLIVAVIGLALIKHFVGYASFEGEAGFIHEIDFHFEGQADNWAGVYGLALRIVGYTDPWQKTLQGNTITQGIFLFDCLQPNIEHEIYASLVNASQIDWDTLQAATPEDVDTFLGIDNTSYFSATNMFTENATFTVGSVNYTVPATYTLMYNSSNNTRYDLGILKDGNGVLVFAAHINDSTDFCYRGGLCNYQMLLPIRNGSAGNETYHFFVDPNDLCSAGEVPDATDFTTLIGNVTESGTGNRLSGVVVVVADYAAVSNSAGSYNLTVPIGDHYVFAILNGYRTYWNNISLPVPNSTYVHNIVMSKTKVGDYTSPPSSGTGPGDYDDPPAQQTPTVEQPMPIEQILYRVSIAEINRKLRQGNFIQEVIHIISLVDYGFDLNFDVSGPVAEIIDIDTTLATLEQGMKKTVTLTIFGKGEPRTLTGNLDITGNINTSIPITIEIIDEALLPVEALLIDVEPYDRKIGKEQTFKFRVDLQNLLVDQQYPVRVVYTIQDVNGTTTYWSYEENVPLYTAVTLVKKVPLPSTMEPGDYVVTATAHFLGLASADSAIFEVTEPFYEYSLFGLIPIWMILVLLLLVLLVFFIVLLFRKQRDSKRKYKMRIDYGDLPKQGPRGLFVGNIAETHHKTYFDMDQLKMHSIIAGSTGSGKSFTAQVLVEELLDKNVAVLVFDPTAQWTGMLRRCKDKSILKAYKQFGMNKNDAKAFNGGLRKITNPFEEIEIDQYVKPGEIQVFAINQLEPEDIEIFVSNTIRQVFKQNFNEQKELRLVLVYDEVHRLLPKFGGAGIGFLQLERGLREFRKWGIGIVMISHVLNDFVDQVRANISTQIQMKTRDENDLERINMKYGQNLFRSMVRTKVGTGLVVNADYNRGEPYFVEFRPIKHELTRLSEEELKKYHGYNLEADQIAYEIQQLEELKVDTFNLKLELKLLTKKLKEGSFHVVDIYLEELRGELDKAWKSKKKKPKKKTARLVDKKEIEKEIKKAEEERALFVQKKKESQQAAKPPEGTASDVFARKVALKQALHLDNGAAVQSLEELLDVVQGMTDTAFGKHVSESQHDLADWVHHKLGHHDLAKKLRKEKTRPGVIRVLSTFKENQSLFGD